jgi:hypothetical protein
VTSLLQESAFRTTAILFLEYLRAKIPHFDMLSYVNTYTVEGVDTAFISFGTSSDKFVDTVIKPYCLSTFNPLFNLDTFWISERGPINLRYYGVYFHPDLRVFPPAHYLRIINGKPRAKFKNWPRINLHESTSTWLCPRCTAHSMYKVEYRTRLGMPGFRCASCRLDILPIEEYTVV